MSARRIRSRCAISTPMAAYGTGSWKSIWSRPTKRSAGSTKGCWQEASSKPQRPESARHWTGPGSRMDVGKAHHLQPNQFGDAARHDVLLGHSIQRAPVDLPLVQRVLANEEPHAVRLPRVDRLRQL